jgi:carbon monoxide dehydrogenase subunit G
MDVKGQYRFDATVSQVWALLMDPATISACLPGCQAFEPAGEDAYRVVLNAGVAAISGSFQGTVTIADKRPETSYRLLVEGSGRPGFVKGESTISLTSADGTVIVDVAAVVTIGGLVAQVGQRLLGATARMMMDRFFNCLKGKLPQDGRPA